MTTSRKLSSRKLSRCSRTATRAVALLCAAVLCAALLCVAVPGTAFAQPTVNGQFYGDGDDALYQPYATSEYGSVLYSYLDISTLTLYVALVVDHSVNDMVCGNRTYTSSTGWNPPRGCDRLSDSEFAEFSLECAPGSPNAWTWKQGFGCAQTAGPPESDWVSDSTCGSSDPASAWPPGVESTSSTSWVANINTYQDATTARAWDLYVNGTSVNDWKSPFLSSAPNDATQVPGYDTYSGSNYEWEWHMIYEWSVELGAGGADCGNEAIFFVTGVSHHSPSKNDDENDDFPPPDDPRLSDWGDNPDSYGTTSASGGARHYIKTTGPYLGSSLQTETDGIPTTDATGDGPEEDGITAVVDGNWTDGSTQQIEVVVGNADGGALLAGWFDWNGDGDFDDAGEYVTWNVTTGTNTLDVTVGSGFDWQNDGLYTRFRIFSSAAAAPGGSLTQADSVGTATDGEVEDHFFEAGSLPVTLAAFESWRQPGGDLTVRWQTASETDNAGFQVWGRVAGEWQPLTDLIGSHAVSSGLPQTYEARISAPPGVTALELADYDLRGRAERFGSFPVEGRYGDFQAVEEVDWSGPRAERAQVLARRGFGDTAGADTATGVPGRAAAASRSGLSLSGEGTPARWKRLHAGAPLSGVRQGEIASLSAASSVGVADGPLTHVAVTEAGVQRVPYEALRDGGLDLAGVRSGEIAVTFRGEAVERWVDGPAKFGPGSAIEFLGHPPAGDDALYVDANLYQVSVDRARAESPGNLGIGKARNVSPSHLREVVRDRPLLFRHQSPTGDPWVERSVLVRRGREAVVTLDVPVDGPVADGPGRLVVDLGSISDLPDRRDAAGDPLPEHNVEVWFRGPGGAFFPVTSSSVFGQTAWRIEAELPAGELAAGVSQIQLRFSTDYFFSLVVVDDYGVLHPAPYLGPGLDFASDPDADGYRIEGFDTRDVAAYAQHGDGSLTRLMPRVERDGKGYAVELRQIDGARYWVTAAPHAPAVFTTGAPSGDLLAGPADLVVIAGSSFVGSRALDDYLEQRADYDPVVIDVEDVYNAVGHGMAVPSAITDYLRLRDRVHPFTHVQLVGTDCYDRLNYISGCVSHLPLPFAPVGTNRFTPSQNRLVDLDGDGVGDKAVAQFSVRDEAELATVVAKADAWQDSGLWADDSALFIAEETDGIHGFADQVDRLSRRLGWSDVDVLDLADHPSIGTARDALRSSLGDGRTLTVYSGHSSPTVWAFRGLLTVGTVPALPNEGLPTLMVPLACETTWDISPNANVLGHQLLFGGDGGAVAISGAAALSSLEENERMANHVLEGLEAGLTLGEAVLRGRRDLGTAHRELQDNWVTQGDVALELGR